MKISKILSIIVFLGIFLKPTTQYVIDLQSPIEKRNLGLLNMMNRAGKSRAEFTPELFGFFRMIKRIEPIQNKIIKTS